MSTTTIIGKVSAEQFEALAEAVEGGGYVALSLHDTEGGSGTITFAEKLLVYYATAGASMVIPDKATSEQVLGVRGGVRGFLAQATGVAKVTVWTIYADWEGAMRHFDTFDEAIGQPGVARRFFQKRKDFYTPVLLPSEDPSKPRTTH